MSSNSAAKWMEPADSHAGEVRKLSTLLEASQALSGTLDLRASLQRVLEILGDHHGAIRSTVVLLNDQTGDVQVEASAGAIQPGKRVRYRLGEGITGRVVESGKPIVVPRVSREPMFLHRAAERPELPQQELSYVSAPITLEGRTVGAIGIDLRFKADRDYHRTVKFLGVVGSMIAQAVKVHRLIEADRQRLVDENTHLRQELKERYDFSNLVGTSGPMRQVYEQVARVARTNTTVLLRGESGTGKELIAQRDSLQLVTCEEAVRQGELCRVASGPDRIRALRIRERCVHGSADGQERAVRDRRRRDVVSRRDRRPQSGDAGEAPARAAGARIRAARQHRDGSREHPARGGDQQRSREGHCRRRIRARICPIG